MKKNVTSTDSRKPEIVAAFKKQVVRCSRVTLLTDLGGGLFKAHCLGPAVGAERTRGSQRTQFVSLGYHEVNLPKMAAVEQKALNDAAADALSLKEEADMGRKLRAGVAAEEKLPTKPRRLWVSNQIMTAVVAPDPVRIFTAEEKAFFKSVGLQDDGNTPIPVVVKVVVAENTDGLSPARKAWATRRARAAAAGKVA